MEYVAYKPHTFSWFMCFINRNLDIKRLGDFVISFSSRFVRAKPKPKVPHLFLPKPGVSRVLLQSF